MKVVIDGNKTKTTRGGAKELLDHISELFTKEEVIAMLVEVENKIIDKSWNIDMYDDDLDFECCYLSDIDKAIRQEIDKLKEK